MTEEEFQRVHGPAYRKFKKTELHPAILSVLRATSPARENMNSMPPDTVTATVLLGREQERQKVIELLDNGLSEPPPSRVERDEEYKKDD